MRQVEAAAHKKHGGADGVEAVRKAAIDNRQEKRATKRKQETDKVG